MQLAIAIVTAVVGSSGLTTLLVAILNRRWAKEDEKEKQRQSQIDPEKIDALSAKLDTVVNAQKVILIDRIRYLGECYIYSGEITLDAKETLIEMHSAFEEIGDGVDLTPLMDEVEKLKVVQHFRKK